MSNALSMDLRLRFKQLMEDKGMNAAAAGRTLLLGRAPASRWGEKVRNGKSLAPVPSRPRKGSGKLEPYLAFLAERLEQDRDITPPELQAAALDAHGLKCSTSGIDGLLRRHGYTFKKRPDRTGPQQAGRSRSPPRLVSAPRDHATDATPVAVRG